MGSSISARSSSSSVILVAVRDSASFGQQLFGGAIWMFAVRWVMRVLSVINIAILARLLDTNDFGLVALASAAIALPAVLTDLGVEYAIICERAPTRGFYNTAWTIRAIQLALAAVCIFTASPWIAGFYGDPRITPMLQILSAMLLLKGAENIWTVSFRKDLDFRTDFVYEAISKLMAVIFSIVLAVVWRSYWALVYSQVAAAALRVVISFFIAPHWPRPTFSHWRQIWSFSQWSLANGAASYLVHNGDRLILGRFVETGAVGAFSLGREIADMPLTEISMPANRALGPGLSAIQDDPNRLVHALTRSLAAVGTLAFPIGVGLAVTAPQVVPVFLGGGWEAAIPILQLLSIASTMTALRGVMGNTLAVIGHIRSSAIVMWVRGLSLVAAGIPATILGGAQGMAAAFLVTEAFAVGVTLFFYRRHLPLFHVGNLGRALVRPGLSTVVMVLLVAIAAQTPTRSVYLLLAIKALVGAFTYTAVMYLLWLRSGYPDGLETLVMERLRLINRPS